MLNPQLHTLYSESLTSLKTQVATMCNGNMALYQMYEILLSELEVIEQVEYMSKIVKRGLIEL